MSDEVSQIVRNFIFVFCSSFGTGVFWSFLAAGVIRHVFDLDEDRVLSFFGVPMFSAYFIWCFFYLYRMLRKLGVSE